MDRHRSPPAGARPAGDRGDRHRARRSVSAIAACTPCAACSCPAPGSTTTATSCSASPSPSPPSSPRRLAAMGHGLAGARRCWSRRWRCPPRSPTTTTRFESAGGRRRARVPARRARHGGAVVAAASRGGARRSAGGRAGCAAAPARPLVDRCRAAALGASPADPPDRRCGPTTCRRRRSSPVPAGGHRRPRTVRWRPDAHRSRARARRARRSTGQLDDAGAGSVPHATRPRRSLGVPASEPGWVRLLDGTLAALALERPATRGAASGGRPSLDGPFRLRRGHRPAAFWTPLGVRGPRGATWEHAAATGLARAAGWIATDDDWQAVRTRTLAAAARGTRSPTTSDSWRPVGSGCRFVDDPQAAGSSAVSPCTAIPSRSRSTARDALAVDATLFAATPHRWTRRTLRPQEHRMTVTDAPRPDHGTVPAARAPAAPRPDQPAPAAAARRRAARSCRPSVPGSTFGVATDRATRRRPVAGVPRRRLPVRRAARAVRRSRWRCCSSRSIVWWGASAHFAIPLVWLGQRRRRRRCWSTARSCSSADGTTWAWAIAVVVRARRARSVAAGRGAVRAPLPRQAGQGARAERVPAHRRGARADVTSGATADDMDVELLRWVLLVRLPARRRARWVSTGASRSTAAPSRATSSTRSAGRSACTP